jgi:rhodanese-related sulfurtransferase
LDTGVDILAIETNCNTIKCLLDDLSDPEVRSSIPKEGTVIIICETGNRDIIAMRYLHKFGYDNIFGLRFGMRGWIKLDYPVEKAIRK